MSFQVTWEKRPNNLGLDDRIAVLASSACRLEIWPALGFNAYRWQAAGQELLYRSPQFFDDLKPTRSGFPILFPFPNRIRDGRFTFPSSTDGAEKKSYSLPLNDPSGKNAIHGFTVSRAWRVVDQGTSGQCAWMTGEFHGGSDAPDVVTQWPADFRIRVTYRLFDRVLRVEADVDNPDSRPLPFGLGYHPYFALAPFGASQAIVAAAAPRLWELKENLPTGKILEVDDPRDLRHGQLIAKIQLDDVMTGLYSFTFDEQDQIGLVGVLRHPAGERMLTLWTSADFRELVLFTPPHRDAICLEPYTCTTDAINLSARGIDAGWRILAPGEHWRGIVEMHLAT